MAAPTYVAQGTAQAVTTSGAMPYPAGLAAGDLILLVVSSSVTGIGNAPAGWTEVGTITTSGSMSTRRWSRIATGSESGNSTVNVTSGTKGVGYTVAYRPSVAGGVLAASAITTGADTTSTNTSYSAAGSSWTVAVDNLVVLHTVALTTGTFSGNSTGITLTQSGATFTKTDRFAGRTGTNTIYYGHQSAAVTAGSTNAPTLAMTTVGGNGTGQTSFIRVTETVVTSGDLPQVTETPVASTLTAAKAGDLPRVAFTESGAAALTGAKAAALPPATDAPIAATLTGAKAGALPQVSSSDVAQTLTAAMDTSGALPRVTESPTATTLTASKSGVLPRSSDSEVSQSPTGSKTGSVARVDETDTGRSLVGAKTGPLPVVTESSSTPALTGVKAGVLPRAASTETATTLTYAVEAVLPRVTETQTARTLTGAKAGIVIQPGEADTGTAPTGAKAGALPTTVETQVSRTLTAAVAVGGTLPMVLSTELAQTITGAKAAILSGGSALYPGGIYPTASTYPGGNPGILVTDDAAPLAGAKVGNLVMVVHLDGAGTFTGHTTIENAAALPRVTETSTARAVTGASISEYIDRIETEELAIPIHGLKVSAGVLPRVLELDVALTLIGGEGPPLVFIPAVRTLKRLTTPNVLVSMTSPNTLAALGVVGTLTPTTGGTP